MSRSPMTFVGNGPYPRRRGDWADLGRTAVQLLSEREKGYPAMIAAEKLDQALADARIRVMRAVVAIWRTVLNDEPLPEPADFQARFGATWEEMREDLDRAAVRARELSRKHRDNRDAAVQAELVEALAWQHQPVCTGSGPHIWLSHDYQQWERRRAAS